MEKVFVHPECPFSADTFNLLAQFYENPSSDFYITHKKDFLKYVEEPVKYILSQVEEQLPDFIKKHINIKYESCCVIDSSKYPVYIVGYMVGYCSFNSMIPLEAPQLMLKVEGRRLIFGLDVKENVFQLMLYNYKKEYRDNIDFIEILKGYDFSSKGHFYLESSWRDEDFDDSEHFSYEFDIEDVNSQMDSKNNLHELLENILENVPIDSRESKNFEGVLFGNIFAGISLESQQVLEHSAQQLSYKIAQIFKKIFPLFLCSTLYDDDSPLLITQYFSVYEKEFNRSYNLEEISELTGFQTSELDRYIRTINRKGQTIIQGPPGTGKTFIAERLAKHLIGGGDGFSDIIQFHPAYTYEDFIEGLRPINQNGQLTYSIVPGRFLEFCTKAEAREDTCVLIIDEINRANLSQVFGELMYLLDDRQNTQRFITLASGTPFRIPTNVRIIGTMNTADRSIALVDNALRRRFAFIPVYPNYEVLRQYHQREKTGFPVDKLTSILEDVNRAINNKHYELGISFFLTKTLVEDIQDIWQMEIEPYLEEYFFDNQEKMDDFLWNKIKDKLSK